MSLTGILEQIRAKLQERFLGKIISPKISESGRDVPRTQMHSDYDPERKALQTPILKMENYDKCCSHPVHTVLQGSQ